MQNIFRMCNICFAMQNTCLVVQNIYRAEQNIFTALQKFALLCPVAQIASRLFALWIDNSGEQEVRDDYFSMCGRSHTLQDIQISRYILMFELPTHPLEVLDDMNGHINPAKLT